VRVLALVHQDDAGPGVFADAVGAAGHELEERSFAMGDPPLAADDYGVAIVLGGGMHVDQEDRHAWLRDEKRWIAALLERETPVLGVCLGSQLVAQAAGGEVAPLERPEIGWPEVRLTEAGAADPVLGGARERFRAFEWHSYGFEPPPGADVLAENGAGPQAYRAGERTWGIAFHAEVAPETPARWLERYRADDDVRAAGVDPGELRRESEREIGRWNAFGRELCGRFLEEAAG
jgi:GMP synthase-like glutamine amidotransferase